MFLCSLQCIHHHADAQEGQVAGYLILLISCMSLLVGFEGTAIHRLLLVALVAGGVVELCHAAVGIILLHVQVDLHEVESIVAVLHGCGGRDVVACLVAGGEVAVLGRRVDGQFDIFGECARVARDGTRTIGCGVASLRVRILLECGGCGAHFVIGQFVGIVVLEGLVSAHGRTHLRRGIPHCPWPRIACRRHIYCNKLT